MYKRLSVDRAKSAKFYFSASTNLVTAASGSTLGTGFTCIGANRTRNGT